MTAIKVASAAELLDALAVADDIEVDGSLSGVPMITLRPVQVQLSAIAVSIQPTGRIGCMSVGGSLSTYGDDVVTLDVEGALGTLKVQQQITAAGVGSDAIRVTGEVGGLDEVTVTAAHGQPIVRRTREEQ